jgi:hypothetical protein
MLPLNREWPLVPFIQNIPPLIGYPGHDMAIGIQRPVLPAEPAGIEIPELQALDRFQLVEKGVKLWISIVPCILPVEGDVRGIVAHLTSRAGRGCE